MFPQSFTESTISCSTSVHILPLGALAGAAIKQRGLLKWAVLGLIAFGALIEIIQAFVGRDPSLLDGINNGAGVIAGILVARFVLAALQWDYVKDTPSGP